MRLDVIIIEGRACCRETYFKRARVSILRADLHCVGVHDGLTVIITVDSYEARLD